MTTTPKPDEFASLTREMLITQILQLRDLVTMERASLASAREEIAKLRNVTEQQDVDWAAERAARERAEFDAGSLKEQNNILGECYKRAEARVKVMEEEVTSPSHPRQAQGGEQVIKCEGGKR